MKKLEIVSGSPSISFWAEINSIDEMSTSEDIRGVLYSMACKMQELEGEIEKLIERVDLV